MSDPASESQRSDRRPPVVLVIRDGWGQNPHPEHQAWNAIELARTPIADGLAEQWPSTVIRTSGEDVGLPAGVMGNSEVGHQNLGAGRVVDQEVMRITRAVRNGSFFSNPSLVGAFEHARRNGSKVHLLGLVSDGRVHSDIAHLLSLLDLAEQQGWPGDHLLIHAITDGRDTGPQTGLGFAQQVEEALQSGRRGSIASVIGRYWAMDRDHRWERVAWAYRALTGRGQVGADAPAVQGAVSAEQAIRSYYESPADASRGGDEFIPPTAIYGDDSEVCPLVEDGDALIFFNFRGDRPREISKAFMLDDQAWTQVQGGGFARGQQLQDLYFCTMTRYEKDLPVSAVAFEKPPKMADTLGQWVSEHGLRQLRCAETEKYPHVTFFFNDYRDLPFAGEERILLPSPKEVSTYDQKPEMAAEAVCAAVLERLAAEDGEDLFIVNFANPDMVGHTGKLEAVIEAVEVVDRCVGHIVEATLARGGSLIVCADHGNAEQTWDPELECPHTAHTTFDVPLHLIGEAYRERRLREGGRLADVAPTLLQLLGLEQPAAMAGKSLLSS